MNREVKLLTQGTRTLSTVVMGPGSGVLWRRQVIRAKVTVFYYLILFQAVAHSRLTQTAPQPSFLAKGEKSV